jgi:hypothetical protein
MIITKEGKTKSLGYHQFDILYIVLCEKTLEYQYFNEFFLNIPLNEDLYVLKHYIWNVLITLHVLYVKQSKISIILYILGGFLICPNPNNIRYKISMNSMIFMVVFKCF